MHNQTRFFKHSTYITASIVLLLVVTDAAFAGPPFLTDDPQPVDFKHSEFYVFSTYDHAVDATNIALPAFEYNYGILPDTQFHVGFPYEENKLSNGVSFSGAGDMEIGVKYRFIHETDSSPQVAIFPMAILATGDTSKGLGNGRTTWRLPVWIQKSWNEWTTYGGGGYFINHAPGQENYYFGGWLLQRDIHHWTLGGEVFARSKDVADSRDTSFLNVGGLYKFTSDFNLLFSVGHSISGDVHSVGYVGLWWGFGDDQNQHTMNTDMQNRWSLSQR